MAMPSISSDSTETDALLNRAASGDEQAFQSLMQRHIPYVHQSVRRRLRPQIRPRIDPSDVVQETQRDAFQRLDEFLRRRPMPFRLWLLRTAHQRVVDVERERLRRPSEVWTVSSRCLTTHRFKWRARSSLPSLRPFPR